MLTSVWSYHSFGKDRAPQSRTDAKDKFYGLLGLLAPSIKDKVYVDYNSPLMDVYALAARLAIEEAKLYAMLTFARDRGDPDNDAELDWPSWIPRYDRPASMELNATPLRWQVYKASGKYYALPEVYPHAPLVLRVLSLWVGTVKKVSAAFLFRPFWSPRHVNDTVRTSWKGIQPLVDAESCAGSLEEVFCHTLVAGVDHRNEPFTNDSLAAMDFHAMLSSILSEEEDRPVPDAVEDSSSMMEDSVDAISGKSSPKSSKSMALSLANISRDGIGSDLGSSPPDADRIYEGQAETNHHAHPAEVPSHHYGNDLENYSISLGAPAITQSFDLPLPLPTGNESDRMTLGISDGWNFSKAFALWCENRCVFVT